MRIALFTEVYVPYINGVITHVSVLAAGLRALGHEVLIVTADPSVPKHVIRKGVLRCPAAVMKKIYGFGLSSPYSPTRMKILRDFNPDILHVHTEYSIGFSGVSAARKLKKPLVYTLHTMYDDYVYYLAPKFLLKTTQKALRAYIWRIARYASAITGPSYKVQEYMKELGVPTPVHVIHNCTELDAFCPDNITPAKKLAFRAKYSIRPDEFVCVFVGRLGKEKSVDVMLDYWAKAIRPDEGIRLIVVGDGPDRPALIERARALGLLENDQVIFTGRIEHVDMPPVYAGCDVYLTTSLSDTNSISMLEGMATGLPTLQRLDPLIAEQVVNGVNGYVFDSAEEMAKYIRLLRDMPADERATLTSSVIASVEDRGAVALAKNLLEVYNSVLGDRARKHWKYPSGERIPLK